MFCSARNNTHIYVCTGSYSYTFKYLDILQVVATVSARTLTSDHDNQFLNEALSAAMVKAIPFTR